MYTCEKVLISQAQYKINSNKSNNYIRIKATMLSLRASRCAAPSPIAGVEVMQSLLGLME